MVMIEAPGLSMPKHARIVANALASPRLVIFSGNLSESVCRGLLALHSAWPGAEWLVVLHRPRRSAHALVRSQALNVKRHGWRWLPHQAGDLGRRLTERTRSRECPQAPWKAAWNAFLALSTVRLLTVDDMASVSTLQQV